MLKLLSTKLYALTLVCVCSQNALPSDDDDKDPNDPHKALDIDLDKYVPHCRHLQFIYGLHVGMHQNYVFTESKIKLKSMKIKQNLAQNQKFLSLNLGS